MFFFYKIDLCFVQCVKKAVMLDSGNHTYWSALGVVAMTQGK